MLKPYQTAFIELIIQQNVLQFGEFILKSGRKSPYFFNLGQIKTGHALALLGGFYAEAIKAADLSFDVLFGPAYKGIPIACATAIAFSTRFQQDIPYSFNRKEVKDHGEGGCVVGASLKQRVLLVDDVMTAGTATRQSIQLIESEGGKVAGMVIALDRQEKGQGNYSAVQEIKETYQIPVMSIITLSDVETYLASQSESVWLTAIQSYREQYGV